MTPTPRWNSLFSLGTERTYPADALVFLQGEPADALYVVREGRVRVSVADPEGREVILAVLGPGDPFGEVMLSRGTRAATVRTLSHAVLCRIERDTFEQALVRRPELGLQLIRALAERIGQLIDAAGSFALSDVSSRLARCLESMAVPGEGGRRRTPPISQRALAARVGASRSMVNHVLQQWRASGHVCLTRGGIELNAPLPLR